MTFAEFRQWAWECHGYEFPYTATVAWRVTWGSGGILTDARAGLKQGTKAAYGPVQQRRLAFWLRARDLIADDLIQTGFIAIRCGVEP